MKHDEVQEQVDLLKVYVENLLGPLNWETYSGDRTIKGKVVFSVNDTPFEKLRLLHAGFKILGVCSVLANESMPSCIAFIRDRDNNDNLLVFIRLHIKYSEDYIVKATEWVGSIPENK